MFWSFVFSVHLVELALYIYLYSEMCALIFFFLNSDSLTSDKAIIFLLIEQNNNLETLNSMPLMLFL